MANIVVAAAAAASSTVSATAARRIPRFASSAAAIPNRRSGGAAAAAAAAIHQCRSFAAAAASSSSKRPPIFTKSNNSSGNSSSHVEGVWYTPQLGSVSSQLDMGRYGLKRIDYSKLQPPVWTLPPHPPTKNVGERILFPLTLLITVGFGLWAYLNPEEEDMRDYWKRVETGQILVEDDDDDEWEYDDDEEED